MTNPTRSTRMPDPLIGSDALFLSPQDVSVCDLLSNASLGAADDRAESLIASNVATMQSSPAPQGNADASGECASGDNGGSDAIGDGKAAALGMLNDVLALPSDVAGSCDPVAQIVNAGESIPADAVQAVQTLGSGSPLQFALNSLHGALGGDGDLVRSLDHTLDAAGLDTKGLADPVTNLATTIVSDAGQTVGAIGNGGSINDVVDAVGQGTATLLADVLHDVNGATGNGVVGDILSGVGGDIVNGVVGGGGLLDGTPLAGLQGNGALVAADVLRGDDSSPTDLLQVGAGTDPSKGLLNIDVASNRCSSDSNHVIDTDIGPQMSGNGITADLLGASPSSMGALIDVDAGQHAGPSLVNVNIGTAADQFRFPSLAGVGADSLVGEVGSLPGQGVGTGGINLSDASEIVPTDTCVAGLLDHSSILDASHVLAGTSGHGALA
jgi:hypothetical protein